MITFILAQNNPIPIADGLNQVYVQYGALAFFALLGLILVFRIWKNSEDAKNARQLSDIEKAKEDTKRDGLISDLASRSTKLEEQLRNSEISYAKLEGAFNLLNAQFQQEKERWNDKQSELKQEIDRLSTELGNHKAELNGKSAIIIALQEERDKLDLQVKDMNAQLQRKDKNIEELLESKQTLEKRFALLEAKSIEQQEQIITLAKQLAALPTHDERTIPLNHAILDSVASTTPLEKETDKELNKDTNNE